MAIGFTNGNVTWSDIYAKAQFHMCKKLLEAL
jgi:hypothetical protein